jgi:16S rRNA (uracil1498-N3)-methyltransferase
VDRPQVDPADEHHLHRVLRLRPGEVVSVADGAGTWRLCTLEAGGGLQPAGPAVREPAPATLTVGFAPPKGDRPEWAVARLTELGVTRIVPLVAARSVVRWDDDRWAKHRLKWATVVRQAAMQSRQVHLPLLEAPTAVGDLLGSPGSGLALAVPGGDAPDGNESGLLVGPEGGWSPEEERMADRTLGLGPAVLRTETAAVVGATLCAALRFGLVVPSVPRRIDHSG